MNKKEVVVALTKVMESFIDLTADNEVLKEKLRNNPTPVETEESKLKRTVYEIGLERLFERSVYANRSMSCSRKEDGSLEVTPYEEWIKEAVTRYSMPESLSYEEVMEAIKDKCLKAYYENVEETIERFTAKESKKASE